MVACTRICCAIDFSEASLLALVEAAELARFLGAELSLIHVHAVPEDEARPRPEAFEAAAVDLHRDVSVWRAEAARRSGGFVRAEVVAGDPAAEILRFLRASGSGLLVIGARGRSAASRRLGSVAARVAREAPCAVLVVRARVPLPDETPAPEPLRHAA